MNKLIILLGAGLLSACAVGYNPRYYYNEIQVVNLAGAPISDVSLRVTGVSKTLACDEVAKFAMCADRFGKRLHPLQGFDLAWTHPDGSRKTASPDLHVEAYFSSGFPLRIVFEINQDGSVKAFHEQDEPDGESFFITGSL